MTDEGLAVVEEARMEMKVHYLTDRRDKDGFLMWTYLACNLAAHKQGNATRNRDRVTCEKCKRTRKWRECDADADRVV